MVLYNDNLKDCDFINNIYSSHVYYKLKMFQSDISLLAGLRVRESEREREREREREGGVGVR